ncbi:MAG: Cof-type HAD-IIB family hydrolase [Lactobacillus sp.]|jgi:Cof subfamily protein (haloacid dehalogenase superfamily)|nr:Cof-type HAD-IIB family hydrolase [Lactobacillus sp.]
MYKLITCDLDETLLDDSGVMTPKTIGAIKAALAKGVYFVPNSGRSYTSFQDNLKTLGLAGVADSYSISFNGALTIDNEHNAIIADHALDLPVAKQIYDITMTSGGAVHVYTPEHGRIWHPLPYDVDYLSQRGVDFEVMADNTPFDILGTEPVMKIIVALPTMAQRIALRDQVVQQVTTPLSTAFSSDRYIEFNRAGVDKGRGVVALAADLGIKPAEIIAIGDNSNDLPMIKAAGLGVSVANGIDAVKAQAQYVTQNDNNHDAVAEVIEKFVL